MTPELRQAYKLAVSNAVREREESDGQPRCAECGADMDCCTLNCRRCLSRKFKRKQREAA